MDAGQIRICVKRTVRMKDVLTEAAAKLKVSKAVMNVLKYIHALRVYSVWATCQR